MRNKLALFIVGFYVLIFLLPFMGEFLYLFSDLQLNPFDYARITDVDYKAVVVDEPDSEGKVIITERLTFDIHAASKNNLFWELWRDLPEDYIDGVKVDYKVHSVKQILPDGREIAYEESPKLYWDDNDYVSTNPKYGPGKWYHSEGPYSEDAARYECVFFYVDGLYREEVVFEVVYEMHNAALRYGDCSDLYLALYSESTVNHLESFKAQILFPNKDMPSPGNYDVFTYGTNTNDFPVTESATLNPGYYTFSFELDEEDLKFRPYNQYIEFDLVAHGEDKHIFTEYAPSNYYSEDDVLDEIYEEQQAYADAPGKYIMPKIIVFVLSSAITAFIIYKSVAVGKRMKNRHFFYEPVMKPEFFREIPSDLDPNFAASLVFCKQKPPKDDSGVYSAILLSLARKKYVKLQEWLDNDIKITITWKTSPAPAQVTPSDVTNTWPYQTTVSSDATTTWPYQTMTSSDMSTTWTDQTTVASDTTTPLSDTGLEATRETYERLTTCEEYYFNLLVRHAIGDEILMSDFQSRVSSDYENTDSFARNMENSIVNIGVREGYFQKADYAQPRREVQSSAKAYCVIGILFITLVNIISYQTRMDLAFGAFFILGIGLLVSSVYLKKQSYKYILLTQFGEDEYAKWRGLYNFLNSETLISERTVIELPLWEKYLVYATAFGLSEKIINAIAIRCPEVEDSPVLSTTSYRSGRFHHSSRSFRSAVRSGSSVARSGGGFSGGGFGYGGGGRGGGGGGGGH